MDHGRGGDEGPLREVEHEHAGDQERQVVRDAAVDVQQQAEDQEVDAGVQQRGEHLPELAEPGFGVHRDVARGREGQDEAPPPPELPEVVPYRRPLGARPQAVRDGELGQRLVRQVSGGDRRHRQVVARYQATRRAQAPVVAHRAVLLASGAHLMRPGGSLAEPAVGGRALRSGRLRELCGATITTRLYHSYSCAIQLLLWPAYRTTPSSSGCSGSCYSQ